MRREDQVARDAVGGGVREGERRNRLDNDDGDEKKTGVGRGEARGEGEETRRQRRREEKEKKEKLETSYRASGDSRWLECGLGSPRIEVGRSNYELIPE